LDQSLDLYQELARAVKTSMRYEAIAIASNIELRHAARSGDRASTKQVLERALSEYPNLVSISVIDASGGTLGSVARKAPLDAKKENKLEVIR
jgi:hypothetical protein